VGDDDGMVHGLDRGSRAGPAAAFKRWSDASALRPEARREVVTLSGAASACRPSLASWCWVCPAGEHQDQVVSRFPASHPAYPQPRSVCARPPPKQILRGSPCREAVPHPVLAQRKIRAVRTVTCSHPSASHRPPTRSAARLGLNPHQKIEGRLSG